MRKNLLLLAGSFLICLLAGEMGLRIWVPHLGADLFQPAKPESKLAPSSDRESPFLFNPRVGYELKPFALVQDRRLDGRPFVERMNREGFRGPEYAIPKPEGIFRILALGDSVVQAFSVSYGYSWEKVLEELLNRRVPSGDSSVRYEVLNAGIGGYVSWQVPARLETHGLQYQPDLVLVLVGWNDLVYSSLPEWKPGLDLSQIERAYVRRATVPPRSGAWTDIRMFFYRHFYTARLVRQARNGIWNARRMRKLLEAHQVASGLRFNEEALRLYLENLERTYRLSTGSGARMALILPATLLIPELLDDPEVHRKLVVLYDNFPLSTRESWSWYQRYTDAQRQFASRHPDVILIDAAGAFARRGKKERLQLFFDHKHLTPEGNRLLAEAVWDGLRKAQATSWFVNRGS